MNEPPAAIRPGNALWVLLGNQLFPPSELASVHGCQVFMAEDLGLCTFVRHHRQKITLFLSAMRSYRDELEKRGFDVHYDRLEDSMADSSTYELKLAKHLEGKEIEQLVLWQVEDKFFERRIEQFAADRGLELIFLPTPMFLTSREEFADWLGDRRPRMSAFYEWQRRRLGILIGPGAEPIGGKWSFDAENRRALPKGLSIPEFRRAEPTEHVRAVIPLVEKCFRDHPGELSEESWWLPTTRRQALAGLRAFLVTRFAEFGPYEDAMSRRDPFLFHSVLTPALNLGLITPREVIDRAVEFAEDSEVPLPSLEGFVRQIIGWREFVRGIYQRFDEEQQSRNFFEHRRRLTPAWWSGDTGIPPLDAVIEKAQRYGYAHHIERLMVVANLMVLTEIEPAEAYRWFMEMFVDSSDWVMAPNVFGMGLFSDGGIFSTKPYICGSSYLFRMSDETRSRSDPGPGGRERPWWDIVDGLYWRFIGKHREFFSKQARMAQAVHLLDRMEPERHRRIAKAAEHFLSNATQ